MIQPIKVSSSLSHVPLLVFPQRKNVTGDPPQSAQATGFLWLQDKTYYLITNWHNVTGWDLVNQRAVTDSALTRDSLAFRLVVLKERRDGVSFAEGKYPIIDLYGSDGRPAWLEHPTHGPKVDVVAIKIGEVDDDWTMFSVPINNISDLMDFEVIAGDEAFVLGYPLGLHGGARFPIWKRASIASEPAIDLDGLPKILIDTATRRGMSGSPVIAVRRGLVNPRGVVGMTNETVIGMGETFLGVYSGRVDDDPLGAQIGIVWKGTVVEEIVKHGVPGTTPFDG